MRQSLPGLERCRAVALGVLVAEAAGNGSIRTVRDHRAEAASAQADKMQGCYHRCAGGELAGVGQVLGWDSAAELAEASQAQAHRCAFSSLHHLALLLRLLRLQSADEDPDHACKA